MVFLKEFSKKLILKKISTTDHKKSAQNYPACKELSMETARCHGFVYGGGLDQYFNKKVLNGHQWPNNMELSWRKLISNNNLSTLILIFMGCWQRKCVINN